MSPLSHDDLSGAPPPYEIEGQPFSVPSGIGLSSNFAPFSPTMVERDLSALTLDVDDSAELSPPLHRNDYSTPRGYNPRLVATRHGNTISSTSSPAIHSHSAVDPPQPIGLTKRRTSYKSVQAKAPTAPLRGTSAWAPIPNLPPPPQSRVSPASSASAAAAPWQTWTITAPAPNIPSPIFDLREASSTSVINPLPGSLPTPRPDHPPEAKWSYHPQASLGNTTDWSNAEAAWSARPNAVLSSPSRTRNTSNDNKLRPIMTTATTMTQPQIAGSKSGASATSSSSSMRAGRHHHHHDSQGSSANSRGSKTSSSRGVTSTSFSTTSLRNTGKSRDVEQHSETSHGRKPYHPKAPSGGSNWVMWVGNVPHDATSGEATEYFNDMTSKALRLSSSAFKGSSLSLQPSSPSPGAVSTPAEDTGIESIFLILQSHCAFVNYTSEAHLQRALVYFNGRPFRPGGVKLVCRIRRKAEEIKSGVGGQRGLGLHKKWVEQHALNTSADVRSHRRRESGDSNDALSITSLSNRSSHYQDALERYASHLARPPQPEGRVSSPSNSTTSTLLTQYFPMRYFVLKAMTKSDLQLSASVGLWATQPHNEYVLDQAYRTSKNVYLIFGANKAGEFHGFAKMDGPILHPRENQFALPQREDSSTPQAMPPFECHLRKWDRNPNHSMTAEPSAADQLSSALQAVKEEAAVEDTRSSRSPEAFSSIPSLVMPPYPGPSISLPPHPPSTSPTVSLSPSSLLSTKVSSSSSLGRLVCVSPSSPVAGSSKIEDSWASGVGLTSLSPQNGTVISDHDPSATASVSSVNTAASHNGSQGASGGTGDGGEDNRTQWGTPFRVRWIIVRGLPFHSTRMLRNPWNKDREVKVSRDGTELEPLVGRALLDLWEVPLPDSGVAHTSE